jgi:hypothetical protein
MVEIAGDVKGVQLAVSVLEFGPLRAIGCIDFSVEAIWRTRVGEFHLRVFERAELARRIRSSWVVNTTKRAVFVSPGR